MFLEWNKVASVDKQPYIKMTSWMIIRFSSKTEKFEMLFGEYNGTARKSSDIKEIKQVENEEGTYFLVRTNSGRIYQLDPADEGRESDEVLLGYADLRVAATLNGYSADVLRISDMDILKVN